MGAVTPDLPFGSSAPSLRDHELPLVRWSGIADSRAQPSRPFCLQPPGPHCRRFLTLPLSATTSRFHGSDFAPCQQAHRGYPAETSFLSYGLVVSPPAALHPASRRRSCFRLQAGERMPEEDFHLSDYARSQSHWHGHLAHELQPPLTEGEILQPPKPPPTNTYEIWRPYRRTCYHLLQIRE